MLVFGDPHLSCVYEGTHKNYALECYKNMDNIIQKTKDNKASAVILLGDIVGVNERNIKDRRFLMRVMMFLQTLNDLTGGNVYSVKGNHDKGDFPDFDLFIGLGLLKNPDYVDYYKCSEEGYIEQGEDALEVRFHFVNYGEENRKLSIDRDGEYSNIVIGHADYLIDGVTNWYQHKDGVHLNRLANFKGVDLVVSGHIHTPSDQVHSTAIGDWSIDLFYPGSPSRTSERFNDCWYVTFEYEDSSNTTAYDMELFGLDPVDEVFHPKEVFIDDDSAEERIKESESLTSIVKEIMAGRSFTGDLFTQVKSVPWATDVEKELACDYLRKAIDISK